jgi:hypothetical protein
MPYTVCRCVPLHHRTIHRTAAVFPVVAAQYPSLCSLRSSTAGFGISMRHRHRAAGNFPHSQQPPQARPISTLFSASPPPRQILFTASTTGLPSASIPATISWWLVQRGSFSKPSTLAVLLFTESHRITASQDWHLAILPTSKQHPEWRPISTATHRVKPTITTCRRPCLPCRQGKTTIPR